MKKPLTPAASDALKSLAVPAPETPPPPAKPGHVKVTFSLYPADVEAMEKIMDTLRQGSIFANRSDALKIAFRYAAERAGYEDMKAAYHAIKSEDGRR